MKVSLDLHDLSPSNTGFFYLQKLRELYPGFKLSAFYTPFDTQHYRKMSDYEMKQVIDSIRFAVAEGWLELIPHGITHTFGEFQNADYKSMELALQAYDEYFKAMDVPYVKGFCAPNWLYSDAVVKCLNDHDWFMAVDKNQPDALRTKKVYEYSWDIKDSFPGGELVKGHGHMSPPAKNDLVSCMKNIIKIPSEAEWVFVSSLVK